MMYHSEINAQNVEIISGSLELSIAMVSNAGNSSLHWHNLDLRRPMLPDYVVIPEYNSRSQVPTAPGLVDQWSREVFLGRHMKA